jgi:hypothetical protein
LIAQNPRRGQTPLRALLPLKKKMKKKKKTAAAAVVVVIRTDIPLFLHTALATNVNFSYHEMSCSTPC